MEPVSHPAPTDTAIRLHELALEWFCANKLLYSSSLAVLFSLSYPDFSNFFFCLLDSTSSDGGALRFLSALNRGRKKIENSH